MFQRSQGIFSVAMYHWCSIEGTTIFSAEELRKKLRGSQHSFLSEQWIPYELSLSLRSWKGKWEASFCLCSWMIMYAMEHPVKRVLSPCLLCVYSKFKWLICQGHIRRNIFILPHPLITDSFQVLQSYIIGATINDWILPLVCWGLCQSWITTENEL